MNGGGGGMVFWWWGTGVNIMWVSGWVHHCRWVSLGMMGFVNMDGYI